MPVLAINFGNHCENLKNSGTTLKRAIPSLEKTLNFPCGFVHAHNAKDIVECVLPEVRSKAGLTDPCRHFTTNNSESLNHVIKQEVNWK